MRRLEGWLHLELPDWHSAYHVNTRSERRCALNIKADQILLLHVRHFAAIVLRIIIPSVPLKVACSIWSFTQYVLSLTCCKVK